MKTVSAMFLAGVTILLTRPATAEPAVELEMQLLSKPGAFGASYLGSTGGGGLIGLPIGPRSVLSTGLELSGFSDYNLQSWYLSVPLMLKLYLRDPAERKLVPLLRLGAAYSRRTDSFGYGDGFVGEAVSHDLELSGTAGVTYFISNHLGVGLEAGLGYIRRLACEVAVPETDAWSINARWQASLVLRL